MTRNLLKECAGELLGTFIMVFIGCAAVALADIVGVLTSLYQVAFFWGIGVCSAIMISKKYCPSHLNPAVTLAMSMAGKIPWKKFLPYSLAQVLGAMFAALTLYFIFSSSLSEFEAMHGIIRGESGSHRSAMMFGEFFPNPAFKNITHVSWIHAALLEALGAFILLVMIFLITRNRNVMDLRQAVLIGTTVAILICFIAPYTQCGINPARDLGPRIVAFLAGWKQNALPIPNHGALSVYVISPFIGAAFAAVIKKTFPV
jgi:glycerol uptake facilitator protein